MTKIIEHFGLISKEEKLSKITDAIVPNTGVYEAKAPYPGYYDYFQKEEKPLYIYLTTKTKYSSEKIIRSSYEIQEYLDCKFSIAWGTIKIYHKKYNVIRILGLENYGQIKPLQEEYIKHGIEPRKTSKKKIKAQSIIKLHKLFQLIKIEDDVYFDNIEKFHAYFYIPKELTWEQFLAITKKVKYNWDKSMFDATVGYFYTDFKLQDIIRIYNKNIDKEYLQLIKEKYLSEINR
ncbi:MAG: hypothetical protein KAG95_00715 [Bacteroidales bacterium]|nr:hypothetical protein [Bacteroidales bacterium]